MVNRAKIPKRKKSRGGTQHLILFSIKRVVDYESEGMRGWATFLGWKKNYQGGVALWNTAHFCLENWKATPRSNSALTTWFSIMNAHQNYLRRLKKILIPYNLKNICAIMLSEKIQSHDDMHDLSVLTIMK